MRAHVYMTVVTLAFSKRSVFAIYTNMLSNLSTLESVLKRPVFGVRKHRFIVDGGPDRIKKNAFSNFSGLAWTGPKIFLAFPTSQVHVKIPLLYLRLSKTEMRT